MRIRFSLAWLKSAQVPSKVFKSVAASSLAREYIERIGHFLPCEVGAYTYKGKFYDVGVAGVHRLLGCVERLKQAQAIVIVAGMEGALASLVSGLVKSPIVAVPTSCGYGANFSGLSALLTMLNSCSPGIAVVNIDNGFGAGYFASLINRR